MKKVKHWTIYKDNVSLADALDVLKNGTIGDAKTVAIQNNHTERFYDTYSYDMIFKPADFNNDWMILVPDTDKEEMCEKIRKMCKEINCTGLAYAKIDNMSLEQIWEHVSGSLNYKQQYKMLKLYFKEKVYKKD